jgi:hypothetical protein
MLSQKPQNGEAVLNPDIGGSRMSVRILVLAGPDAIILACVAAAQQNQL